MAKDKERHAWMKVIDVFKELSYLYDKNNKEYYNRDMRHDAYKMLHQLFNENVDNEITLTNFKKKLENMRTSYGRELKKVKASKQTASGASDIYVPSLWYFNVFEFLEGIMEPCRKGTDTLAENDDSDSKAPSPIPSPSPAHHRHSRKSQIRELKTEFIDFEPEKSYIEVNSSFRNNGPLEDECAIVGKRFAYQLRGMKEKQRLIAEKIIADVMFCGRMEKLTENSFKNTSDTTN